MHNPNNQDRNPNDPRFAYAVPPFPAQHQTPPGSDRDLQPKADHGEESYVGTGKLKGKVALITGGDSGIGRAVAIAFAREGADLVISYLSEGKDAKITADLVKATGREVVTVAGDITAEAHCQSLVERTLAKFGRIDILVNNAASQMSHEKLEQFSSQQFEKTFRTNVFAPFYLAKAAVPHMQPGASIINTASIQGFEPDDFLLDYASSKSALIGFTKALAKLAIEKGIRVNAVAPGPVWTPFIPTTMPAEKVTTFGHDSAFGRPAQPAEMAPVYVLLASREASFITGEVYGLTGGKMPL